MAGHRYQRSNQLGSLAASVTVTGADSDAATAILSRPWRGRRDRAAPPPPRGHALTVGRGGGGVTSVTMARDQALHADHDDKVPMPGPVMTRMTR